MRVSSTLLVALTGLLATATAIDPLATVGWGSPSADREGSSDRQVAASKSSSKSSKAFEKLGFCNIGTLKGRYTSFSNGNADISGVFARPPNEPRPPAENIIGPVAVSSQTYFDGRGRIFTQSRARPDKGGGAVGALAIFNQWSNIIINKNCTTEERGVVIEYLSPIPLIIAADDYLVEGAAAPDGSDTVFTSFVTNRIQAFSGDNKRVAKFALPPQQFKDGPPEVPTSCNAEQSCISRYLGAPCTFDIDCRVFCSPFCDMFCADNIGIQKRCIVGRPPVSDDK